MLVKLKTKIQNWENKGKSSPKEKYPLWVLICSCNGCLKFRREQEIKTSEIAAAVIQEDNKEAFLDDDRE